MLGHMTTDTLEQRRETFGAPIVTIVMQRESFDRYRAELNARNQADLDSMVDAGTVVVRESS